MAEVWTTWEGRVINGLYPLRRLLGSSDHSGVFLTESKARGLENVAIKLLHVDAAGTKSQLSHWQSAAALSHPHLIQLFETGRCQVEERPFLFVTMEYADQTLAQLLPQRALTVQEVRELLPATFDALTFLHQRNLVHCRLKPTNFLVVHDRLKLASDTVRPLGQSTAVIDRSSAYDSPEAKRGRISPAGDVWSLAMTLTEALTQTLPSWSDEGSDPVSLPQTIPAEFADPIRQCLNRDSAKRPSLAELATQLKVSPRASSPTDRLAAPEPSASAGLSSRRLLVPGIAVLIALLIAAWAGVRLFQSHPAAPAPAVPATPEPQAPSASVSEPAPPPPAAAAAGAASSSGGTPPQPSAAASAAVPGASAAAGPAAVGDATDVTHEEIPDVPRSARDTIHGHIKVLVHVTVDSSGNVVDQSLTFPGPSKYFARLATEAASKWKFTPTGSPDSRARLLHFDFSRGGTTGHATIPRS